MATHDYIISNASGASVRADLNNALAAIVSNNSNATSPATTYAYQWWADTTTGQLKLRNSANSAWITIFELDGTMLMEDGTVSAPGLAFASDLNTGFFRSAADKINFATGGAERLEIGSSEVVFNDPSNDVDFRVESNGQTHMLFVDAGNDRVGVGTSSPSYVLDVKRTSAGTVAAFTGSTDGGRPLKFSSADNGIFFGAQWTRDVASGGGIHAWSINGTERLRIESSGRLLSGTSNARTNYPANDFSGLNQIEGAGTTASFGLSITHGSSIGYPATIALNNHKSNSVGGTTATTNGFPTGTIKFKGSDGTNFIDGARIFGQADGDWSSGDCPGRLVFSTTSGGGSSPLERVRIDGNGRVGIGCSDPSSFGNNAKLVIQRAGSGESSSCVIYGASNASSLIQFSDGTGTAAERNAGFITVNHSDQSMRFGIQDSERLRIESSGRLLSGTTSAVNLNNAGGASAREAKAYIFNTTSTTSERYNLGLIGGSANSTGCALSLNKTRATTNTHTVVQSGDELGDIRFQGSDGSFFVEAAKIRAMVDGTPGSQDMPGRLEFHTTADGGSSATERVRIHSNGFVQVKNRLGNGVAGDTFEVQSFDSDASFAVGSDVNNSTRLQMRNSAGTNTIQAFGHSGNLTITGALSKGSGSFKIDHPLSTKSETHHLVHSFIEGPQADNIYRGQVDLVGGTATVNLDTAARMTEGTFVLLNTNVSCFTSNETDWTAVRGSVFGNILTIEAQDNTSTATVSWMVVGERHDQHMLNTEWTDANGRVIVEPVKQVEET